MRGWSVVVYEIMVVVWIVASPLAIGQWVDGMADPVSWAAFIAGVFGVLVGWLVVAPHELRKRAAPQRPS